ncbi:MAG: choice-of-anchor J domain-containing protein, partial [Candidatus Zixiibacteriota bacterium]
MRKTLVLILLMMLPLAWVWSAGEDSRPDIDNEGVAITPVKDGNLLDSANPIPDPPVILTNILSQDFEEVWDPGTPPTGWTIIDNGTEGSQCWFVNDWSKHYYNSWSDTVAYFYRGVEMETAYDEWLITPDVALSAVATACS